jgi:glycosyltransferase involved in cell wall biosynthesis
MKVIDRMQKKTVKIIMLGESLARQGGIVSVEKLILQQAPSSIQYRHIATLVNGSVTDKVIGFGRAIIEFLWVLSRTEFDLVHIHVAERGSAFRKAILTLIALIFHKPIILHAHGPEFHSFYSNLPQVLKHCLSWIFGRSDRFIVLSESWKNFYRDNVGLKAEQVVVLPNPVKLPVRVPNRANSQQIAFVFLGRIGQRKGTFDSIEAFAALPAEYQSRSCLILAGDGEVKQARNLIANRSLSNCITVYNWLNPEQRNTLLARADVFVLPSYNEGMPMSLLEAMSWSLPVITTPVGGIPEIVTHGKNGLLVSPGNTQQLSAAMQSLIDDENLRFSLGSSARESVIPLDVNNYFNNLIDVYRSVLDFH